MTKVPSSFPFHLRETENFTNLSDFIIVCAKNRSRGNGDSLTYVDFDCFCLESFCSSLKYYFS
jgi:hypothetical protein